MFEQGLGATLVWGEAERNHAVDWVDRNGGSLIQENHYPVEGIEDRFSTIYQTWGFSLVSGENNPEKHTVPQI